MHPIVIDDNDKQELYDHVHAVCILFTLYEHTLSYKHTSQKMSGNRKNITQCW